MQYATPGQTWTEWIADNDDRDEATKLAALREIIAQDARTWVEQGDISPAWANKKMAKLGVTDFIRREIRYTLTAPVSGNVEVAVYATNRAEALAKAKQNLDGAGTNYVTNLTATGEPVITVGPEDMPSEASDDAPQTVEDTLTALREIIMLGNISGPRYCTGGADRVLAQYGLAAIPPRKTFKVSRPVTAEMVTEVEAFDEASALRVAAWRWDDSHVSYDAENVAPTDELSVSVG